MRIETATILATHGREKPKELVRLIGQHILEHSECFVSEFFVEAKLLLGPADWQLMGVKEEAIDERLDARGSKKYICGLDLKTQTEYRSWVRENMTGFFRALLHNYCKYQTLMGCTGSLLDNETWTLSKTHYVRTHKDKIKDFLLI